MSISETKRKALDALKGNWGAAVGIALLMFVFDYVITTIIEIVLTGGFDTIFGDKETPVSVDIVNLIVSIVFIPFSIATNWYFLNLLRGENPKVSYVFSNYQDIKLSFKLIWGTIIQSIFIALWSLLLLIPGIIKGFAYSQMFFILKDNPDYSIKEAITESRKRMNGLKGHYFLLLLSFIGWLLLAIPTCGIALLWVTPYILTSLAAFYEEEISSQGSYE